MGGGDGGPADGGGGDGGCAQEGYVCGDDLPCCNNPMDPVAYDCDPIELICVPEAAPDSGPGPGLPFDGSVWSPVAVKESYDGIASVAVASSSLQVAGASSTTDGGSGAILVLSPDGGWSPLPNQPASEAIASVWLDPAGDLFAAGKQLGDGGGPLLLEGTFTGGVHSVAVPTNDGGNAFSELLAVVGLGPHEALVGGSQGGLLFPVFPDGGMRPITGRTVPVILHLYPDGGALFEQAVYDVESVYRLRATSSGEAYGLASVPSGLVPDVLLVRRGGFWLQLPTPGGIADINDLVIGPANDVSIVGDDGDGNGVIYSLADGGPSDGGLHPDFIQVAVPALPPITAACEPSPGTFYFAVESGPQDIQIVRSTPLSDGGTAWTQESLPADTQSIASLASDGSGDVLAGGSEDCPDCPGWALLLSLGVP